MFLAGASAAAWVRRHRKKMHVLKDAADKACGYLRMPYICQAARLASTPLHGMVSGWSQARPPARSVGWSDPNKLSRGSMSLINSMRKSEPKQ